MSEQSRIIIGLGELLWDCFDDSRRPGGAPANVAFHAAQLGAEGVILSRVGADDLGNELVEELSRHGLNTQYIQPDAQHPTGTVRVDATHPDRPAYEIREDVAWDYMVLNDHWSAVLARASAVCFGTLAQRSPVSRKNIGRALDTFTQPLCVYDVNLRPPWFELPWIRESLKRADVVKLNLDEVAVLGELFEIDAAEPADFADELLGRFNLQVVCITRGAGGCLVVSADEEADVVGQEVTVVDAVGAGDAFTAALTIGLLSDWPLDEVAQFANEVGALVASRSGATPDLRRELVALLADRTCDD